jgi:hypothetical protein
VTDAGLPDGWRGEEDTALHFGVWRFYRLIAQDVDSSVREDNWVTRDGRAMPGEAGLRVFLDDLRLLDDVERVPAAQLAARTGHFLIRGESRQSCFVRVVEDDRLGAAPPSCGLADGGLVLRAWFQRDGYRQPVKVEQARDGGVRVHWGEIVVGS